MEYKVLNFSLIQYYLRVKMRKLFFVVKCQKLKSAHTSLCCVDRYRPLESSRLPIVIVFFIWYLYGMGIRISSCFLYY